MPLSLYTASVPVFTRYLGQLSLQLSKADAFCSARGLSQEHLLHARLYPDMAPLISQIRTSDDFARRTCAPLAGLEIPQYAYQEQSLAELKARIERTLAFLAGLEPSRIHGQEEREIITQAGDATLRLPAAQFLQQYALPNFFFHLTTAYAILRHVGVPLGKGDFDGHHAYPAPTSAGTHPH